MNFLIMNFLLILTAVQALVDPVISNYEKIGSSDQALDRDETIVVDRKPRFIPERFIVELDPSYSHSHLEDFLEKEQKHVVSVEAIKVHHHYEHVFHGITVSGASKTQLLSHPGVRSVSLDLLSLPSWGLARISKPTLLPPAGEYRPDYTGRGVDVYIVDTGIDTTHSDFASSSRRIVQNIFVPPGFTIEPNTDVFEPHGTAVASIVGGYRAGVSPNCSIYGLDIFGKYGVAYLSVALAALDLVAAKRKSSKKPSVVNLGVEYDCTDEYCHNDVLVRSIENLIDLGVVVVAAAGNEGGNACFTAQARSPRSIAVGASTLTDEVAPFSNYGNCVHLFAPGVDVEAACGTHEYCDQFSYSLVQGTSMAAAHVSGVVAQLLEKYPSATPAEIAVALSCGASRDKLLLTDWDTVTRNLIVQIPRKNDSKTCNLGLGCPSSCSGQGVCAAAKVGKPSLICHCNKGRQGTSCNSSYAANNIKFYAGLFDYPWDSQYALLDSRGNVAGNMIDTIPKGNYKEPDGMEYAFVRRGSYREFSVTPGVYSLKVSPGSHYSFIGWRLCGFLGGAPFEGTLTVKASGDCEIFCNRTKVPLLITGSGLDESYLLLRLRNFSTFQAIYENFLPRIKSSSQHLCVKDGCYIIRLVPYADSSNHTFTICGINATDQDRVKVCVSGGSCFASILPRCPPGWFLAVNDLCYRCPVDWDCESESVQDNYDRNKCPEGTYTKVNSSLYTASCESCKPGHTSVVDSLFCTLKFPPESFYLKRLSDGKFLSYEDIFKFGDPNRLGYAHGQRGISFIDSPSTVFSKWKTFGSYLEVGNDYYYDNCLTEKGDFKPCLQDLRRTDMDFIYNLDRTISSSFDRTKCLEEGNDGYLTSTYCRNGDQKQRFSVEYSYSRKPITSKPSRPTTKPSKRPIASRSPAL